MSSSICLDSSVLIKILTWEEDSEQATELFKSILEKRQTILLPDFACVEIGSVLRKKVYQKNIQPEEAEALWDSFLNLNMLKYIKSAKLMEIAWLISIEDNLPVLYDAAYLAVAVSNSNEENICQFWTADQKLLNTVSVNKKYLMNIKDFSPQNA